MALCADEARLTQNLAPAKQVFIPRMAVGELDDGARKVNAPETRGPSQTPIPLRRSRKRKKRSKPAPYSSSPRTLRRKARNCSAQSGGGGTVRVSRRRRRSSGFALLPGRLVPCGRRPKFLSTSWSCFWAGLPGEASDAWRFSSSHRRKKLSASSWDQRSFSKIRKSPSRSRSRRCSSAISTACRVYSRFGSSPRRGSFGMGGPEDWLGMPPVCGLPAP